MKLKLKDELSIDTIDNKLVILNTETNKLINVNDVGKIVIEYIRKNENLDFLNIIHKIKDEFKCECSDDEIKSDIITFVKKLVEIGVLVK